MAINETIVTGRKHRRLIDKDSKLWQRTSFWTKARDVEFDDGQNLETKIANIINFFRAGVEKIVNKLRGLGFTPSENSPDGICNAIDNVYNSRYQTGYQTGQQAGYQTGYQAGQQAGHQAGYDEGYAQGQANFRPVIKLGSMVLDVLNPPTEIFGVPPTCFSESVYIPAGLDYVCTEITSTSGFTTMYNTNGEFNRRDDLQILTEYDKDTGEVHIIVNVGHPFYRASSPTVNYKIMYIQQQ